MITKEKKCDGKILEERAAEPLICMHGRCTVFFYHGQNQRNGSECGTSSEPRSQTWADKIFFFFCKDANFLSITL